MLIYSIDTSRNGSRPMPKILSWQMSEFGPAFESPFVGGGRLNGAYFFSSEPSFFGLDLTCFFLEGEFISLLELVNFAPFVCSNLIVLPLLLLALLTTDVGLDIIFGELEIDGKMF